MRFALLGLLAACNPTTDDTSDDTDTDAGLEIAGTWLDDFGGTHAIDEDSWTMSSEFGTSVFHISQRDAGWLVAENDPANAYNPSQWSRFDWLLDGADLWFCQTVFDAADEDAALAAAPADATDPSTGGCGGYSWSHASPSE